MGVVRLRPILVAILTIIVVICCVAAYSPPGASSENEGQLVGELPGRHRRDTLEEALAFLEDYNSTAEEVIYASQVASWAYYTNLTEYNAAKSTEASLQSSAFSKQEAMRAKEFNDVLADFPEEVQRQLNVISDIGVSALDNATVEEVGINMCFFMSVSYHLLSSNI